MEPRATRTKKRRKERKKSPLLQEWFASQQQVTHTATGNSTGLPHKPSHSQHSHQPVSLTSGTTKGVVRGRPQQRLDLLVVWSKLYRLCCKLRIKVFKISFSIHSRLEWGRNLFPFQLKMANLLSKNGKQKIIDPQTIIVD